MRTVLGLAHATRARLRHHHRPTAAASKRPTACLAGGHPPAPAARGGRGMSVAPFPTHLIAWERAWLREGDKPLPVGANVLATLRLHQGLRDAFAYDEMQRAPVLIHTIGMPLETQGRPLTDEDITKAQELL